MYTLFLQTRGFNISPFVYMMHTLFLQTRGFKILPFVYMVYCCYTCPHREYKYFLSENRAFNILYAINIKTYVGNCFGYYLHS
jgi:hypothetical protein